MIGYMTLQMIDKRIINPITCEIDPSNRCQNNCSFCMYKDYRARCPVDMPLEMFCALIDDLQKIGVKSITFTGGGEPLMNPHFNAMATIAHECDFKLGLITNGIAIDKVESEKFEFIRVSIDAATSKTYKNIKGTNAFDKVIDNLKLPLSCDVGLSFVVCDKNRHEINLVQQLIRDMPWVKYIQIKPEYGKSLDINTVDKHVIKTDRYKIESLLPCYIAGLVGIVGADGHVWYCCQKRGIKKFSLGSLQDRSFSEIWSDRYCWDSKVIEEDCKTCRYQNYVKELYNPVDIVRHKWFL